MDFLKAEQLGTAKWRVLAIPFGGPLKGGRDLDREFFSERTDTRGPFKSLMEYPVLVQHSQDPDFDLDDVGLQEALVKERDGHWGKLWLDRQHQYFDRLNAMLRAGKMFGSSGTAGHLVRKGSDGEILVWPHLEQTLTFTPSNVFARIEPVKAVRHYDFAGIELDPAVRSLLSDLDTLTTDLGADPPPDGNASADPSGGGNAPAMARLSTTLDQLDEAIRLVQ